MHDFFEWLNSYAAIPIAIFGFVFTWRQARKAKKAAESAEDATRKVAGVVNHTLATGLDNRLEALEAALESSVRDNNHRLAAYQLWLWRKGAGEYRALLGDEPADKRLKRLIQASLKRSSTAKEALIDEKSDLQRETAPALRAIAAVTGELGVTSANLLGSELQK